jgi:aryl-alcohol dehydrogenase-like predicted oxidoreductase
MNYVRLGRSAFSVSRLGLGGGGHSRLGQGAGADLDKSVTIIRRALDLGVNLIDSSEGYGTEEIIGSGIRGFDRGRLVLSTKKTMGSGFVTPAELREGLEQSLLRLGTDYVDIYHLHALKIHQYDHAVQFLIPEMIRLKEQGKIRAVGVTEAFNADPGHVMLRRAMEDRCWEVIMVGFNILNQSARERVLAAAREKDVGVLCMFGVRTALSRPEKLREVVQKLAADGKLDGAGSMDLDDPLGFVVRDGAADGIVDAAYRFCRDEPGIHVVLSGTGNLEHLKANVAAIKAPPLPPATRERLIQMFRGVDSVSGD